jgi:hypothetical protein
MVVTLFWLGMGRREKGGVKSWMDMGEEEMQATGVCDCVGVTSQQERPYQHDSTASRLLSEVKRVRARLVLRWGTTLESRVLFFFYFWSRTTEGRTHGRRTGRTNGLEGRKASPRRLRKEVLQSSL